MLMMSLAPVLAALLALSFLGESLTARHWAGIGLAVSEIGAVVMDRCRPRGGVQRSCNYGHGIPFCIGAASRQAIGLVVAKQGLGWVFPAP